MTNESISAFIDNEPFDARELADVLATDEGRQLLIDLIALRHVVAGEPQVEVQQMPHARRGLGWRAFAAAAAIVVCAAGSFLAGRQTAPVIQPPAPAPVVVSASDAAPAPTRVIDLKPGINWRETKGGN